MNAREHAEVWRKVSIVLLNHGHDESYSNETRALIIPLILLCNAIARAYKEVDDLC